MGQILSVARITFLEAIRSKSLIIPLVFGLIILASLPFTPAYTSPDRIRIMLSVAFSAISLLIALISVFISTTTMTNEIKDKRIFLVLTRPIARFQYVLGKLMGIWTTLAVLLLSLGFITYLMIQVSGSILLERNQKSTILAGNRHISSSSVNYPARDFKVNRYQQRLSEYERVLRLTQSLYASGALPEGIMFRDLLNFLERDDEELRLEHPEYDPAKIREFYSSLLSRITGVNLGSDGKTWRKWYENNKWFGQLPKDPDKETVELFPQDENYVFVWNFEGLEADDLENGLNMELNAYVLSGLKEGMGRKKPVEDANAELLVRWGQNSHVLSVTPRHSQPVHIHSDKAPPAGKPFTIALRITDESSSAIVSYNSLRVLKAHGSFELNILKSLILSWSVSALIATVGIFASCFLSFPVALLLCLFVLFWGSSSGFLRDLVEPVEGNPFIIGTASPVQNPKRDFVSKVSDAIYNGANVTGKFLANGIDDFTKYEGARYIPDSKDIPNSLVCEALFKLLSWRVLVLMLLGWFIFKFKEF